MSVMVVAVVVVLPLRSPFAPGPPRRRRHVPVLAHLPLGLAVPPAARDALATEVRRGGGVAQGLAVFVLAAEDGGLVVVPVVAAPDEAAVAGPEEEPDRREDHGGAQEAEEPEDAFVVEGVWGPGGAAGGVGRVCGCWLRGVGAGFEDRVAGCGEGGCETGGDVGGGEGLRDWRHDDGDGDGEIVVIGRRERGRPEPELPIVSFVSLSAGCG